MTLVPQLILTGEYGDVFWNLSPILVYRAGTEIFCQLYVANPSDEDREYMLFLKMTRNGALLVEYPVPVDDLVLFPVEAGTVVPLPGAMILGFTDAALTIELYEKEQNEIVASTSVLLTSTGTEGLPAIPGLPDLPGIPGNGEVEIGLDISGLMSGLITLMIVVMMMKMMSGVLKK